MHRMKLFYRLQLKDHTLVHQDISPESLIECVVLKDDGEREEKFSSF